MADQDRASILVVDDEPSITDAVCTALGYEGHRTTSVGSGMEAWNLLRSQRFDLVVLDIMLPDLDGLEVCRRMRDGGDHTPVLFLTARTGPQERVRGLRTGGDDYVEKPFTLAEVVARVEVILRRARPAKEADAVRIGPLAMYVDAHRVERDGRPVELTATEFRLLRYFMENPDRVLSKGQILAEVWDGGYDGDANIVEAYVRNLRRKLDDRDQSLIRTIRLVGYVLRSGAGPDR